MGQAVRRLSPCCCTHHQKTASRRPRPSDYTTVSRALASALLAAVMLSACYHATIETGRAPSPIVIDCLPWTRRQPSRPSGSARNSRYTQTDPLPLIHCGPISSNRADRMREAAEAASLIPRCYALQTTKGPGGRCVHGGGV